MTRLRKLSVKFERRMIATLPALASGENKIGAKAFASFTCSKTAQRRQKSEPVSPQVNGRSACREKPRTKSQHPRCAGLQVQGCCGSLQRREWVAFKLRQPPSASPAQLQMPPPNPSVKRTRTGKPRMAFISFWAIHGLPARSAYLKR